jgi:hypothetical protein
MTTVRRSGRGAPIFTLTAGGVAFIACVSGQSLDPGGGGDAGEGNSGTAGTGTGSGGAASGGTTQGGMSGQVGTGGVEQGGTPATGGAFPTGGTPATGGAFPTGGTPATGGAFPTGGTPTTGGAFPTGGTPATGGSATGGSATGGSATGGKGGTATGGTATGGTATGGTATGGTATGGTGGTVSPPPNINGGQNAWASRYWDCCKPACGWSANAGGNPMKSCSQSNQVLSSNDTKNACESGGSAFMCWNGAPWSVGGQLSYGFVAASGPNYVCGRCFHIQFNGTGHNGTNPGVTAINGKHMIVQVINNGGVAQDQMDILIPGGGVGALNACDDQWGSGTDLGAQYGGWRATCGSNADCIRGKCQAAFSGKAELMAGCEWFIGWYAMADNPNFTYERIACPSAITQRSGLSDR